MKSENDKLQVIERYDPLCSFVRPPDGLPWFVNLNITSRCNLFCMMCQSATAVIDHPPIDKLLAFFDRLGAWLPTPRMVILTGGEPLMHPHIMEIVERLAGHGFIVALNSNGSLLNIEKVERLKRAGLRIINLSLDGIGEVHDRIRNGPGLFQGVMDMIHYMSHHTDWFINVVTVINAINAHTLPDLVRLLARNPRFSVIRFQAVVPTLSRPWSNKFFEEDPLWPNTPEKLQVVLHTLDELERLKAEGMPVNNPIEQLDYWRRYFRNPQNFLTGQSCRVAYDNLNLQADGSIRFCDHFGALGTVDDDPKKLWESMAAQEMREIMSLCAIPCNYKVNCCYLEEETGKLTT